VPPCNLDEKLRFVGMFYLLVQVYPENRSRFRWKFGTNNVNNNNNNSNKEHKFNIIIRNKVIKGKNTVQKFAIYVRKPYWKI
jgi:hypothetical protein